MWEGQVVKGGDREEDVQLWSQPPPHGAPAHSPVGGASTWQASFFLSLKFSGLIQLSSLSGKGGISAFQNEYY